MFFEDFTPGQAFHTGTRTLDEAAIIAFAQQWDRQSFHLDPEAAKQSIYGGLIASGFHTLLTAFDLVIEANVWNEASQGSPGMDHVRWLKPVRPGDTLSVVFTVVEVRASSSRDDRGYVTFDHTVSNQREEVVMTYRSVGICVRRPG
ncbi:MAG: MaoC family dehydratase [Pseudomonadota bacterium]